MSFIRASAAVNFQSMVTCAGFRSSCQAATSRLSVSSSGFLLAYGSNGDGQLRDGTTTNCSSNTFVSGMRYCTAVGTGPGRHSLAVVAPPIAISSLKLSPTSVTGGTSSVGTVTLTAPVGAGGLKLDLHSSNAAAVVPASVTISAGSKSATFTISTTAVTAVTKAFITASLDSGGTTVTLTINP